MTNDKYDKLEGDLDYLRYCAGFPTIYAYVMSRKHDDEWLPLIKETYGAFMDAQDFRLAIATRTQPSDQTTRLPPRGRPS